MLGVLVHLVIHNVIIGDVNLGKKSYNTGMKHILENIDYWKKAPVWTPDTIKDATADWFKYLSK